MGEIRTFRDDDVLKPLLDAIPKKKRSKVVRRALYDYFFKGKDKVMVEDEEFYIETDKEIKIDIGKAEKVEVNFDMFDD
ncbi:MAG: hypothetical protein A2Y34_04415 [Spirochaetes bacterium GWC1_27_15]|nr:MAG: hypothetical protein A2Y34_04415 [Spirochaetes bacterium GWC1_27_15]